MYLCVLPPPSRNVIIAFLAHTYLYRYSNYVFLTPSNTSLRAAGSSPQGHSEVANMRIGVEEGREWSVERNMAWNVSVVTSHQELMRGIKTTEGATRLASRNTCKESWTVQHINTYMYMYMNNQRTSLVSRPRPAFRCFQFDFFVRAQGEPWNEATTNHISLVKQA